VVTRTEAARLRNENLNLRKELEDRSLKSRNAPDQTQSGGPPPKEAVAGKSSSRTYVVQTGDTLASISRKFYKSPARWKKILNANRKNIDDPKKLSVGQRLIIP
jgi:nucleoid-associated protein YgaU